MRDLSTRADLFVPVVVKHEIREDNLPTTRRLGDFLRSRIAVDTSFLTTEPGAAVASSAMMLLQRFPQFCCCGAEQHTCEMLTPHHLPLRGRSLSSKIVPKIYYEYSTVELYE